MFFHNAFNFSMFGVHGCNVKLRKYNASGILHSTCLRSGGVHANNKMVSSCFLRSNDFVGLRGMALKCGFAPGGHGLLSGVHVCLSTGGLFALAKCSNGSPSVVSIGNVRPKMSDGDTCPATARLDLNIALHFGWVEGGLLGV